MKGGTFMQGGGQRLCAGLGWSSHFHKVTFSKVHNVALEIVCCLYVFMFDGLIWFGLV